MSDFKIIKATRVGVIPWIDLYAESGCGKTMSALLMARGLAGPYGDITLIDTETRRGSLYADVIPGGFNALDLAEPFTPARYIEALKLAISSGAKVVVVDSMSAEWEGVGGVCDQAAENESKSMKSGLHNWRMPKLEHAKLVQFLLRCPIPVVCCIRAKYKTRQSKDDNGKTIIIKDAVTSPIQAEDFIFESTCHAEILPNHTIILTKCSHPDLKKCFPADRTTPITVEHGKLLADWCAGEGTVKPATANPAPAAGSTDMKALKKKLVSIAIPAHCPDIESLQQFLHDELFMPPDELLANQTSVQLEGIISKLSKRPVDQGNIP